MASIYVMMIKVLPWLAALLVSALLMPLQMSLSETVVPLPSTTRHRNFLQFPRSQAENEVVNLPKLHPEQHVNAYSLLDESLTGMTEPANGMLRRQLSQKEKHKRKRNKKSKIENFPAYDEPQDWQKKANKVKEEGSDVFTSSTRRVSKMDKENILREGTREITKESNTVMTNEPWSSYLDSGPGSGGENGSATMNIIDNCWRGDPDWRNNRMHLADCAIGYGSDAQGGKGGDIYVVTDPSDNPVDPAPGTLRYGVVQMQPLWIIFEGDMSITLENELIVTSFKTIDGRGARVEISNGPCITIQDTQHVIIHGLSIHHCTPGKPGRVMSSTEHVGERTGSDGDAIAIFGGSHIWIDHNYLAECADGLIDAIHASTFITISNNFFTNHDKVMLLGHSDGYPEDTVMRVTVVYNHFGPGLVQRMPRCRYGRFHVVNNRYTKWEMYALGASADPTILSQGNYFLAPDDYRFKQVTKLEGSRETANCDWRSQGDLFLNGAFFGEYGTSSYSPNYGASDLESFDAYPAISVPMLTADAGPLNLN
ncbi:hypothetical protein KP509_30G051100 [Ceratopteris richardii]|uniref:Pectate lyase n=1 Tax=Ceratopteris richardii TaxID=49495 RepID=A0A8T2R3E8_CERRI|nr:hypothetical protein KP509_30G051100 [Ceratopteris richardii]